MKTEFFRPVRSFRVAEFLETLGGELGQGNKDLLIEDVRPLEQAEANHLSFLANRKYYQQFLVSNAGACIADKAILGSAPKNMTIIISANPYAYYAKVMQMLYPLPQRIGHISSKASVAKGSSIGENSVIDDFVSILAGASIGKNCHIMAGCFIGANVQIGDNVIIYPGAIIEYSIIGNNVVIKSGAKIGQEGFGFATDSGKHIKIRHVGCVVIGDNAEIGSGTTIDRGSQGDTIIGAGVMIDNLVQIGHNVVIGAGSVIVSQVGIAGSTELGKYCIVGGQSGFAGHLKIADGSSFLGNSKVVQNIDEPGGVYAGFPAIDAREWRRAVVLSRQALKQRRKNAGSTD